MGKSKNERVKVSWRVKTDDQKNIKISHGNKINPLKIIDFLLGIYLTHFHKFYDELKLLPAHCC